MRSERLKYRPLAPDNVDAFHALVRDEHVRQYLLDGTLVPLEWTQERAHESQRLFGRRGVGIWLAYDAANGALVGFCGFLKLPAVHPDPQLVYAILPQFVGKGFATEMARASIDEALSRAGFEEIIAGVDEVNVASLRILEKLGFKRISVHEGSFGNALVLRLERGTAHRAAAAEFPSAVPEIPVSNVDEAAGYYERCLGFSRDWGGDEGGIGQVSRGSCRIFLTNAAFREQYRNAAPSLIWLNLNNKKEVDDLHESWSRSGAHIVSKPESKPWHLHEFTARDLDGNLLRVFYDFAWELAGREV